MNKEPVAQHRPSGHFVVAVIRLTFACPTVQTTIRYSRGDSLIINPEPV